MRALWSRRVRVVAASAAIAALVGAASPGAGSAVSVSRSCAPARQIAPGVSFRHCTAKLSNLRSTQQVYMVVWRPGDSRISQWATAASRPGLAASLNGDFFTYTSNPWSALPSGLLVHGGTVLNFGDGGDEQEAGYGPDGRVVIGTPRVLAERLLVPGGASLTVGAWGATPGHRDQVGVIAHAETYTPPTGYDAVALATNPFAHALTGRQSMRNVHGVNRLEPVVRFVLNDPSRPNVTLAVPVTFPTAPSTSVTIPQGGIGLVYRDIGPAKDAFTTVAAELSPTVTFTQPDAAWADVTEVMSGKPVLVRGGAAAIAKPENTTSDQWYAEQWRPAVATRTDGRAMMLVAGSPAGTSTSGSQFGRLLVAFGARDAIQFDNRSSTELYRPDANNGSCAHAGACYTEYDWERDIPLATMLYSRR